MICWARSAAMAGLLGFRPHAVDDGIKREAPIFFLPLDPKASVYDGVLRPAINLAAPAQPTPDGADHVLRRAPEAAPVVPDVLPKAKRAVRLEDATRFCERTPLVAHAAQDQRAHDVVE